MKTPFRNPTSFLPYMLAALLTACETPPAPSKAMVWSVSGEAAEAEYAPFATSGTGMITGQAFLTQQGGAVVKAAGQSVWLDPATSIGVEWWRKQAAFWANLRPDWLMTDAEKYNEAKVRRSYARLSPPSPGFAKARRSATADADGRFKFSGLPAGKYYVTTEVFWTVGEYALQGGLVGQVVEVKEGQSQEVILSHFPQ